MENIVPTVGVLMSTYNGEKYLSEQLDSIFNQKNVKVKLFVRDDGSTDGTADILQSYSKNNYPIAFLQDGKNVGPGASFMTLLYAYAHEPEIDYFAFADQDDIWLEEKLAVAIEKIKTCGHKGPILYSSNQYLYVDGKNTGLRHKGNQSTSLISHMTKNTISGCTFVMNKDLVTLIADSEHAEDRIIKYRLHDAWIMLVAISCGYVIYDENAYILYRIHSQNTVGIRGKSIKEQAKRLINLVRKEGNANLRLITARQLLKSYPTIEQDKQKTLRLYSNYQNSIKDKLALAFNRSVQSDCLENKAIFISKVLFNLL